MKSADHDLCKEWISPTGEWLPRSAFNLIQKCNNGGEEPKSGLDKRIEYESWKRKYI